MNSISIVRNVDDLGRIAIPKEIRRSLAIHEGEPLEIFLDSDVICLKKYSRIESNFNYYSRSVCEAIQISTGYDVAVIDTCKVIECKCRVNIKNRLISAVLKNIMLGKSTSDITNVYVSDDCSIKSMVMSNIYDGYNTVGAIVLLETPKLPYPSEDTITLVRSHAKLFSSLLGNASLYNM